MSTVLANRGYILLFALVVTGGFLALVVYGYWQHIRAGRKEHRAEQSSVERVE